MRLALLSTACVGLMAACGDATAPSAKPAEIAAFQAPPRSAEVGSTLAGVSVVVTDAKGHALAGQPIAILVGGGGSLTAAPASTGSGPTPVGSWTLGEKAGPNTLMVSSGTLLPLVLTVQGTVGQPAKLVTTASTQATSIVGRIYNFDLKLTDRFDNPVGGSVHFDVTGGGTLSAVDAEADAATGAVPVPTWTLGKVRGSNTLTARAGGGSVTFAVAAQPDAPASITVLEGDQQVALAGTAVAKPIRVAVADRFGNTTPGQTVTFQVVIGAGTLNGSGTVQTDSAGVAVAPSWRLGKLHDWQQMVVLAGAAHQNVYATVRTGMRVALHLIDWAGDFGTEFSNAAHRLEAALVQGAPPVQLTAFPVGERCGIPLPDPLTKLVEGTDVFVQIKPIDGPSKVLAMAGVCAFRDPSQGYLPAVSVIYVDSADVADIARRGMLENVAMHELMHALGFSLLWDSHLTREDPNDPRYIGANGVSGCTTLGGVVTCAGGVPLENTGTAGSRGGHWRESTFGTELMTSSIEYGAVPFSVMSIQAMADLGYVVNTADADGYVVTAGVRTGGKAALGDGWERLQPPPDPNTLERLGGVLVRPAPAR